MRTHATNHVGKTILKNCQILENVLEISKFPSPISRFPSPKIRFSSPKIQFSSHKIRFSPIGFLLSSMAFHFLQRRSAFFTGFPLSSTAFWLSSMAFWLSSTASRLSEKSEKIYLRRQVYERSLIELRIFCHLLPELCNFRYNTQHQNHCMWPHQAPLPGHFASSCPRPDSPWATNLEPGPNAPHLEMS